MSIDYIGKKCKVLVICEETIVYNIRYCGNIGGHIDRKGYGSTVMGYGATISSSRFKDTGIVINQEGNKIEVQLDTIDNSYKPRWDDFHGKVTLFIPGDTIVFLAPHGNKKATLIKKIKKYLR